MYVHIVEIPFDANNFRHVGKMKEHIVTFLSSSPNVHFRTNELFHQSDGHCDVWIGAKGLSEAGVLNSDDSD